MGRLIDADELKSKLQARHDNGNEDFDKGYNIGLGTTIDLIDCAPTVEQRPQGKWIEVPVKRDILHPNGIKYVCLACKRDNCYGKPPFCMWCGADMRGGGEKE